MWTVFLTREAEKSLKKLPLMGKYSYRLGDYRMVYSLIHDRHGILLHYVRHRREAYR